MASKAAERVLSKDYRLLSRTGVKVSNICLGTMNFGAATPEADAHSMLTSFVSAGGNFIDTANAYNGGESERIIGRWIAQLPEGKRASLIVATKLFFQRDSTDPNSGGLSRGHILTTVEKQLQRLQTPYIDLLQIHNWDDATPPEEWIRTFADLIRAGKIRHWGVCNVTGWQLQRIVCTAASLGAPGPASVQNQYNLLCREVEFEVLECAAANGISFLPWSPLKGGWLTGKFKRDEAPEAGTRIGAVSSGKARKLQSHPSYDDYATEKTWNLLDAMREVAAAHAADGATIPQVAVRWLLHRPSVASVIIGPRTAAQMEDCSNAAAWQLTSEELQRLCAASALPIPYPYEMVWRCCRPAARLDGNLWPQKL